MNKFQTLKAEELQTVKGGQGPRSVIKRDIDGDGRWDIKEVYRGTKLIRVRSR